MPLDPEVSDLLKATIVSNAARGADLNGVIDRNLVQGLGVIHNNLIQQHGGVSDDAGLIAALQTAARVPRQGAIDA